MLELSGLARHFGALKVLDGVELTVPQGAVVGVIGPNGAGKTTLFNVIAGVLPPSAGAIRFEGRDVTAMPVWDRCRLGIARTYQVPKPFTNMTVFENVLAAGLHGGALSMREASARAEDVLALVELDHRSSLRAGDLSLLDLKRLELAKALGSGPRLLLLDEIAGGLTDAECDTLLDIISTVRERGTTIVWIEHVIRALRRIAGTIAVLYNGSFIATGAPDQVLVDRRVKDVYLGAGQ
jgi:branched-chain amino acid transport system ATP-binding protein